MSILNKIIDGTARGDIDLCRSCRNVHRTVSREGIETRYCMVFYHAPRFLSGPIATCSSYNNAALPRLSDMQEIAWELQPPNERGKVGFITPEDRRKAGIGMAPLPQRPGF